MDATDLKSLPSDTVGEEDGAAEIDLTTIPTNTKSSVLILDKHIQYASLHAPLPRHFRLDILPFAILYIMLLIIAYPAIEYQISLPSTVVSDESIVPSALVNITSTIEDDDLLSASTVEDEIEGETFPTLDSLLLPAPASYHFYALIALPIIAIIHAITALASYWSVNIYTSIGFTSLPSTKISTAPYIRVIPQLHCGSAAVTELLQAVIDNQKTLYFMFQKTKYIYHFPNDPVLSTPNGYFTPLDFPTALPLTHYTAHTGYTNQALLTTSQTKYGLNMFDIPLPAFFDLFIEHAVAPFFVFQIFCVLLWCLDEYWYYSLMTLFMLVTFEATVVQRRLKHLQYLRDMRVPPFKIHAYRLNKWTEIMTNDLLPGDIISMTRTLDDSVCPCDLLILTGNAVVNESLLTGESTPQIKEAIQIDAQSSNTIPPSLSINKEHKRNLLFGGTKLLLTSSSNHPSIKKAPDDGVICYVLRTGFSSSQGKLVRTILFSTERVSVNNTESLLFILFLLIFALIASVYVLIHGLEDEKRSRYKLLLNCIMIITSVVPPELPMELSLAVNTSLLALAKQNIFCTEPFRIPLAGAVDYCCFDKTGTLTTDNFYLKGIAGINNTTSVDKFNSDYNSSNLITSEKMKDEKESKTNCETSLIAVSNNNNGITIDLTAAENLPLDVQYVLAGCHSLTFIPDTGLVGDPLEKSAFTAIKWNCHKNDSASSESNKQRLRIIQRYPFSSSLKRMSTVIAIEQDNPANNSKSSGSPLRVVVKGAAEVMESRFSTPIPNYEHVHSYYSRMGCRVLSMGYKILSLYDTPNDRNDLRSLTRNDIENDLIFAGFLILQCPLKADSVDTIGHLINSSHNICMITGDNILTACHVAKEVGITTLPTVILTQTNKNYENNENSANNTNNLNKNIDLAWQSLDTNEYISSFDYSCNVAALTVLSDEYDIAVSGDLLEYLLSSKKLSVEALSLLIPFVKVYARTSPDQKELILTRLKLSGFVTLMCGDGTNDVGALKQAHIGVALIGDDGMGEKKPSKKKESKSGSVSITNGNTATASTSPAVAYPGASLAPTPTVTAWSRMQKAIELQRKLATEQSQLGNTLTAVQKRTALQSKVQEELKKWEDEMRADEPPPIRLGDASIASPFTSKIPFITSTVNIIRQGRCTLVTTLQMFNILGINCLISAYSMSVLYMDGVKMGDVQMTIAGLSIAMFFLFISRSQPVNTLSSERPPSRLFTAHMMLSIIGQFALHMFSLRLAVSYSLPHTPVDAETKSPEGKFAPNVLNTVVYLVSTVSTISTFAANYRGRPFMQSLAENKWLYRSLLISYSFMLFLAAEGSPEINELMQLHSMPNEEVKWSIVGILLFDMITTIIYSRILRYIFVVQPKIKRSKKGKTIEISTLVKEELKIKKI